MNKFQAPNYTQIPNEIIDSFMTKASPAQFKCVMLILRQTLGWHRQAAEISLSLFEQKTGITRKGVIKSISELEELGHIIVQRRGQNQKNVYAPNIDWSKVYSKKDEVVNSVHQGSELSTPPLVNSVHPRTESLKKGKERERKIDLTDEVNPPKEKEDLSISEGVKSNQKDILVVRTSTTPSGVETFNIKKLITQLQSTRKEFTETEILKAIEIVDKKKGTVNNAVKYLETIIDNSKKDAHKKKKVKKMKADKVSDKEYNEVVERLKNGKIQEDDEGNCFTRCDRTKELERLNN